MPGPRLEDASCAICMENLFNLRDDLDEVLPIATPDCGHVFHEKCLLDWFRSQADGYVAQMLDHGVVASTADAPAECPECRAECFADPETGEPGIHRLFINFTDGDGNTSVTLSQAPPSSSPARWRSADKDVLTLARRARVLTNEMESYGADSNEEDVLGAVRRVSTLREDVVSSKAAQGFKTYVGGLTVAMNRLRERVSEHPLLRTLENKLAEAQAANARQATELTTRFTREMRTAVQREQDRANAEIKRAKKERDLMQRELEKEQVALRAARRAAAEHDAQAANDLAEAKRIAEREKHDREHLSATLQERTRLLKMYQAKAESRSGLKRRIEELEAENRSLRAGVAVDAGADADAELADVSGDVGAVDVSVEEISESAFSPRGDARRRRAGGDVTTDESLVVEDPSLSLDDLIADMRADAGRGKTAGPSRGKSTTARSFTYGADADDDDDGAAARQRRSTTSRTFTFDPATGKRKLGQASSGIALSVAQLAAGRNQSKYFDAGGSGSRSSSSKPVSRTSSSSALGTAAEPRTPAPRRAVLVPSSPVNVLVDASSLAVQRISPKRARLQRTSAHVPDTIEILDSSPEPRRPAAPVTPPAAMSRPPSMLDYLADVHGRPKKGVVGGAKVRRRA